MSTKLSEATNIDAIQLQEQAAAPSDPAAGQGKLWVEDTARFSYIFDSGQDLILGGVIFAQTADKTIASTTTPTTLLTTGEGSLTLAADALIAGRTIRLTMRGHLSDTGTPTLDLIASLGGTTVCTTGAVTLASSVTTVGFTVIVEIVCRTTGGSGTVVAGGTLEYDDGTTHDLVKTTTTTIDTTGTLAIDLTATWGTSSASNTITAQIASIEYLM